MPYGLLETRVVIHADSARTTLEQSIVYTISSSPLISLLGTLCTRTRMLTKLSMHSWMRHGSLSNENQQNVGLQICFSVHHYTAMSSGKTLLYKCFCEGGVRPLCEIPLMSLPECVRHLECPAGELLDSQHGQGLKWKHLMSFTLLPQITKWSLCGQLCNHAVQSFLISGVVPATR